MRKVAYLIYLLFLRNTPEDYRPYALFFPWLRNRFVSFYLKESGGKLRVKSGAEISPHCSVGAKSELGTRCMIQGGVQLGKDIIMGPDVKIYSRNHNYESLDIPIRDQGKTILETRVGDDVWIGANVVITAGCKIGNHCIIAAGAVVTKDIEDYTIAGGVPAKPLKKRLDEK